MTTCKHCGKEIVLGHYAHKNQSDFVLCGQPAEPAATEGTPATQQTEAVCDECSGNGKVLEKCPSCNGSGYEPRTQPSQPIAPAEEFPLRPQMKTALLGCGSVYLVSSVDDYIRRVEAEIASLRSQLDDRDRHLDGAYRTLGKVNRSIYLFDLIPLALAEAERKGWNDAIEVAAAACMKPYRYNDGREASPTSYTCESRIRVLSREPGVSRTPQGEE